MDFFQNFTNNVEKLKTDKTQKGERPQRIPKEKKSLKSLAFKQEMCNIMLATKKRRVAEEILNNSIIYYTIS